MRSMWLVELFEGANGEVKLRAHSFVCFEHARLRKSTVNIDVAGKRARESVENWILLVFISRLGWHLRVQGKTWGLMWLKQKKYFQQILLPNVTIYWKIFPRKCCSFPKATSKELSVPNPVGQKMLPMRFENNFWSDKRHVSVVAAWNKIYFHSILERTEPFEFIL